jgi:hypothetical protein
MRRFEELRDGAVGGPVFVTLRGPAASASAFGEVIISFYVDPLCGDA